MRSSSKSPNQNIVEVYENNFIQEIKRLGSYLEKYPIIGMDTEFPGLVYPCPNYTQGFYYKYIKTNVDKLKLIQLGVSLFNENGESPPEGATWQFNLRFNCEKEAYSRESITLLSNSGIDFTQLKKNGIHYSTFAEYLITSGLVLNECVKWISFNGFSDFAYLLRLIINSNLPDNENEFLSTLSLYFPNFYDLKYIIQNSLENLKGGLNKIAQQLGVERVGDIHQAGSDSIVTAEVYFKIINSSLLSQEEILLKKNILFGIGLGTDDNETFTYTTFAPGVITNFSNNQIIPPPTYNNNNFEQNVYTNSLLPNVYHQNGSTNIINNISQQYSNYEQNQTKRYPYGLLAYSN